MINAKIIENSQRRAVIKIRGISLKLKNPRRLYARWGVQGLKWIDKNFKQQGALLHEGKWKAIKEATKKARRKKKEKGRQGNKYGPKILMDIGHLRNDTFNTQFCARGVYLGSTCKYAPTHHFGWPERNIAKRRILPEQKDETMVKILVKVANNYVKEICR